MTYSLLPSRLSCKRLGPPYTLRHCGHGRAGLSAAGTGHRAPWAPQWSRSPEPGQPQPSCAHLDHQGLGLALQLLVPAHDHGPTAHDAASYEHLRAGQRGHGTRSCPGTRRCRPSCPRLTCPTSRGLQPLVSSYWRTSPCHQLLTYRNRSSGEMTMSTMKAAAQNKRLQSCPGAAAPARGVRSPQPLPAAPSGPPAQGAMAATPTWHPGHDPVLHLLVWDANHLFHLPAVSLHGEHGQRGLSPLCAPQPILPAPRWPQAGAPRLRRHSPGTCRSGR